MAFSAQNAPVRSAMSRCHGLQGSQSSRLKLGTRWTRCVRTLFAGNLSAVLRLDREAQDLRRWQNRRRGLPAGDHFAPSALTMSEPSPAIARKLAAPTTWSTTFSWALSGPQQRGRVL